MTEWVFDIETDGLKPTKIYVLSCWSQEHGYHSVTDYDAMRRFFAQAGTLVGHNIHRFDIPVCEKLLGIKIKSKLVDTLTLSWVLYLDLGPKEHNLEHHGELLGIPKPKITNWVNLPLEDYIHRCQEDVRINVLLWLNQKKKLAEIYKNDRDIDKYLKYLSFKMHCLRLQEESGWTVDVEFCEKALVELSLEEERRLEALAKIMPKVPVKVKRTAPVKMYKADGSLSIKGKSWFELLEEQKLKRDVQETEIIVDYVEGNPKSSEQKKDWLYSLGWVPQTFKHVKNKDGPGLRQIPQINQEHGKGICESIKLLYEKEPGLVLLDSLSMLSHRIPILSSFLRERDSKDRVRATAAGLTNTLRFQHAKPCVNLPKPDKQYAKPVRGSLIAAKGKLLCGADMSSLEDRLKHHYIFPYDPNYVRAMMRDDYDPHLSLAVMAGMMSQEDAEYYQYCEKEKIQDDRYKKIKTVRGIAKNGNYACQYGAHPPRLVLTCGITLEKATELFDGYWKLNHAIKKASAAQKTIQLKNGELWLKNPVSGFYYSLRKKADIFSTLVQGTASYVFDIWVQNVLAERKQLTAQFHDEIVLEIREDAKELAEDLCNRALDKTNKILKLNRELGIGVQFGTRYSEIH